jgi:hypothetical protein
MRMPFLNELRWLLAVKLLHWSMRLTEREATDEMTLAYGELAAKFQNATKHNTIPMRRKTS